MKRMTVVLGLCSLVAAAVVSSENDVAKSEIGSVIERAYVNGAFNDLDTASMKDGFHPTFRIHGVQDGGLTQYPIADWIQSIEDRKQADDFDAASQKWEHKIVFIDATGPAAVAKIELFKDSQHVFTDYLSLMKLSGGWKITDKVYHRHPES